MTPITATFRVDHTRQSGATTATGQAITAVLLPVAGANATAAWSIAPTSQIVLFAPPSEPLQNGQEFVIELKPVDNPVAESGHETTPTGVHPSLWAEFKDWFHHTKNEAPAPLPPPVDNAHVDDGEEQLSEPEKTTLPTMRAKMLVSHVEDYEHEEGTPVPGQIMTFFAVGGDKVQQGYPADGSDEDNTFARWSPSGSLSLNVVNPDLIGKIKAGEKYYLDFTLANPVPEAVQADPVPTSQPVVASSATEPATVTVQSDGGTETQPPLTVLPSPEN